MLLEVGRSFIPAEKSYRARLDRIERAIGYCSMHAEWAGELPRLRREHDETAGEYRTWKANQRGDVDYSDVGITVVVLEVSDTTASGVVRKRDYPWLEIIEGDYLTF
jgi:hypothetical protein